MAKTMLQRKFKNAFDSSIVNKKATTEEWEKAIYKFGIECYIKAQQGKLVEIDYKNNERLVNGRNYVNKTVYQMPSE